MGMNPNKAFALIVAVIFATVALSLGVALSSLGYKQQIISSNGSRSQYAFYAADATLECALYDTQRAGCADPYLYENHVVAPGQRVGACLNSSSLPSCGFTYNRPGYFNEICWNDAGKGCVNQRVVSQLFPVTDQAGQETLCAKVTVYETQGKPAGTTYAFAEGYDVPCAQVGGTNRIVARGIFAHF